MSRFFRLAGILGLINIVGPFATDMYLPSLPSIGGTLHATPAAVQMSLTAYFVTIGFCQLIYGSLADIFGRKRPICAGLIIFTLGSIGCALAPNIETLIGFRVVQAFGACAGMTIPRAVIRDLHTGHEAARLLSLLMLVTAVSPLLAPITGSFVASAFGWRGVFWVLAFAALLGLFLAVTQLNETRSVADRMGSSWRTSMSAYRMLLRDRTYMGLVFVGASGISAFFIYIAGASFVFIDHFGLSPTLFSLCFALNAVSYFGCSQMTGYLTKRFGLPNVIRVAVTGFTVASGILTILMILGFDGILVMISFLFIGFGFLGVMLPTTAVLALERHGRIAGAASALLGSVQMVTGAVLMSAFGLLADGKPEPMIFAITGCAIIAFTVAQLVLRPMSKAVPLPAE